MALVPWRSGDAWDPFRDLWDWQRPEAVETAWMTPIDVYETHEQLVVKAELPGVKPEQIDISVTGSRLSVTAERKHEVELKKEDCYRRELAYGVFQRQLELPPEVDTANLKASYKDGILQITIPKREDAQPKHIKVQSE